MAKHTERAHALLSASSSKRWLTCTPSAKLAEEFENKTSVYAEEGTLAHEIAEVELKRRLNRLTKEEYEKRLKELQSNALFSPSMHDHVITYICQVLAIFNGAKKKDVVTDLLVETKVDFSRYVPQGFGSNDAIVVSNEVLHVIDLKFGQGVQVDAEHNTQLMLYALGAADALSMNYDFDTVKMTIVQPRLDHVSTFEMSLTDLLDWAENELKPQAAVAFKGEGEFVAGDHCMFCPAKARCAAIAAANLELAKREFCDPPLLTNEQIAEILDKIDLLVNWAGSVKKYALDQALAGVKFEGYKLVAGRSNRVFTEPERVADMLTLEGYEEAQIYNKKLKGIGEIEGLLGKKDFKTILSHFVEKPEGAPTLVPVTDKRQEINSAQNDFKD